MVFGGLHSTVGSMSDSRSRNHKFETQSGPMNTMETDHSVDSIRALVSYWPIYLLLVLVNRSGGVSLPRNSVRRLNDQP